VVLAAEGTVYVVHDPETGMLVPPIPVGHPEEWWAFADAIIARGRIEREFGMTYGLWHGYQCWHGPLRELPAVLAHELALVEENVLTTQAALRRAMGCTP
jgi:hypothetical protein